MRAAAAACSATKPKASLFVPASDPSGRTTTQLMAPMRRATGSTASTMASARSLCGMVMLQPEKPSGASARSAASRLLRLDGERHVGAGEPVLREQVVVEDRRARVHHRPAHDAGEQETIGAGHVRLWGAQVQVTA